VLGKKMVSAKKSGDRNKRLEIIQAIEIRISKLKENQLRAQQWPAIPGKLYILSPINRNIV
jgi:hypothetical protein